MQLALNADWLAALHARAWQAALRARVPLLGNGHVIGSVLHQVMAAAMSGRALDFSIAMPSQPEPPLYQPLCLSDHFVIHAPLDPLGGTWQIEGDLTLALNALADQLRRMHVGHVRHYWRGEQLAVCNANGEPLGNIERGAVRPLGIATRAVHLVGTSPGGGMWVQQRSHTKANDPGLWDTLMGGMVSAQDTLQTALARETQEEAGLHLNQLADLRYGGCVTLQRPTGELDDDGIGYVVEAIDWYQCTVPHGVVPVNQDGEVAQFELLHPDDLLQRLHENQFTLEAALVTVAAMSKHTATK